MAYIKVRMVISSVETGEGLRSGWSGMVYETDHPRLRKMQKVSGKDLLHFAIDGYVVIIEPTGTTVKWSIVESPQNR